MEIITKVSIDLSDFKIVDNVLELTVEQVIELREGLNSISLKNPKKNFVDEWYERWSTGFDTSLEGYKYDQRC